MLSIRLLHTRLGTSQDHAVLRPKTLLSAAGLSAIACHCVAFIRPTRPESLAEFRESERCPELSLAVPIRGLRDVRH